MSESPGIPTERSSPGEGTSSADLRVRPAGRDDVPRILELVRLSLGEGLIPRDRAYWEWKHNRNPFGESPILLAEAGGELVGLRVFMRWHWRSGGRTIPAVRAVDTATHPRWQGRGIFRKLTLELVRRMEREGVEFVFNTPNRQSRPGYLKMGWSAVGRTDLWIRPLRPLRILRALATRRAGMPPRPVPAREFPLAQALCARAELAELLHEVASGADRDARLATPRTTDYLRWRYVAIPGFRYHALFEFDGSDGAAVVFRYKEQGSLLELRICELIVGRGTRSRRMARALVERVCKEGRADYVSVMAAASTPERRVVLRSGFLPAFRLGPILTVRPLQTGGNLVVDPRRRASWRLSIGDLELF
jgi:GNAT superfamily N-acetyltransferase